MASKDSYNFPLFNLSCLLSLSGEPVEKPFNRLEIKLATSTNLEDGTGLICLCLNSNHLVFRIFGEDLNDQDSSFGGGFSRPVVRIVPWFHKEEKTVVSIDFDPTNSLLLVVCRDISVYLIPFWTLLFNEAGENGPKVLDFNSLQQLVLNKSSFNSLCSRDVLGAVDITTAHVPKAGDAVYRATKALWWKSQKGKDYAVVGTVEGTLFLINLQKKKKYSIRLKQNIIQIDLLVQDNTTHLLLTCSDGIHYLVLLERMVGTKYQYLGDSVKLKGPFVPQLIRPHLQHKYSISVHYTSYHSTNGEKQVYLGFFSSRDQTLNLRPLDKFECRSKFTYYLAPALQHYFGENFLVTLARNAQPHHVSIILPSLAQSTKHSRLREIQQISVPSNECVLGILDTSTSKKMDKNNHDFSMRNDTFMLYTTTSVYKCEKKINDTDLLLKLCAKPSIPQWLMGDLSRSLEQDAVSLYEIAGDRAHAQNLINSSFHMYKFSSATIAKTLRKMLMSKLSQNTINNLGEMVLSMRKETGLMLTGGTLLLDYLWNDNNDAHLELKLIELLENNQKNNEYFKILVKWLQSCGLLSPINHLTETVFHLSALGDVSQFSLYIDNNRLSDLLRQWTLIEHSIQNEIIYQTKDSHQVGRFIEVRHYLTMEQIEALLDVITPGTWPLFHGCLLIRRRYLRHMSKISNFDDADIILLRNLLSGPYKSRVSLRQLLPICKFYQDYIAEAQICRCIEQWGCSFSACLCAYHENGGSMEFLLGETLNDIARIHNGRIQANCLARLFPLVEDIELLETNLQKYFDQLKTGLAELMFKSSFRLELPNFSTEFYIQLTSVALKL